MAVAVSAAATILHRQLATTEQLFVLLPPPLHHQLRLLLLLPPPPLRRRLTASQRSRLTRGPNRVPAPPRGPANRSTGPQCECIAGHIASHGST